MSILDNLDGLRGHTADLFRCSRQSAVSEAHPLREGDFSLFTGCNLRRRVAACEASSATASKTKSLGAAASLTDLIAAPPAYLTAARIIGSCASRTRMRRLFSSIFRQNRQFRSSSITAQGMTPAAIAPVCASRSVAFLFLPPFLRPPLFFPSIGSSIFRLL